MPLKIDKYNWIQIIEGKFYGKVKTLIQIYFSNLEITVGLKVDEVCANTGNLLNNLEAEDTITALTKFKSGAMGVIEATTAARPEDFEASMSIVGEEGMVVIGGIALNKIKKLGILYILKKKTKIFHHFILLMFQQVMVFPTDLCYKK